MGRAVCDALGPAASPPLSAASVGRGGHPRTTGAIFRVFWTTRLAPSPSRVPPTDAPRSPHFVPLPHGPEAARGLPSTSDLSTPPDGALGRDGD